MNGQHDPIESAARGKNYASPVTPTEKAAPSADECEGGQCSHGFDAGGGEHHITCEKHGFQSGR